MNAEQPAPEAHEEPEYIEITIPARPEFVVIVRLAAAGIAGRLAFSYDDIEDLKIAVSEACTEAVRAGGGPVQVRFGLSPERLEVRITHSAARRRRATREGELGMFLVRCLMDDVRTETAGSQHVTWMSKQAHR